MINPWRQYLLSPSDIEQSQKIESIVEVIWVSKWDLVHFSMISLLKFATYGRFSN